MIGAQPWHLVALGYIDFAINKLLYVVLIWVLISTRKDLKRLVNHFAPESLKETETKES